jgi:hypothetical protein
MFKQISNPACRPIENDRSAKRSTASVAPRQFHALATELRAIHDKLKGAVRQGATLASLPFI